MIFPLDHWLFGNGLGLASPFNDKTYHWLVDTYERERDGRNGQIYSFCAGFGAQLTSFQWAHPKPGERRKLCGYEFVAFNSYRCGPRVNVSWAAVEMARLPHSERLRFLESLGNDLRKGLPERNTWRDRQAA